MAGCIFLLCNESTLCISSLFPKASGVLAADRTSGGARSRSSPWLSREWVLGMLHVLGSIPAALQNTSDRALARGPVPVHATSPGLWCSCILA